MTLDPVSSSPVFSSVRLFAVSPRRSFFSQPNYFLAGNRLSSIFSSSSLHLLFIFSASSLHLLFIFSASYLHLLFIFSSSSQHLLFIFSASYLQSIFSSSSLHLLSILSSVHLLSIFPSSLHLSIVSPSSPSSFHLFISIF